MSYRFVGFNSGTLTVQTASKVYLVEVPIEDGKFITGEALHNYVRGFIPEDVPFADRTVLASNADEVLGMCDLPVAPEPTYAELRAAAYPPVADYLDAIVKGDDYAVSTYISACKAVKDKYPKPVPEQVSAEVLKARREL